MRDFKFRCDHCGKVLDEMHDYTEIEIDLPVGWWQDIDLCKECAEELCQLVGDFVKKRF